MASPGESSPNNNSDADRPVTRSEEDYTGPDDFTSSKRKTHWYDLAHDVLSFLVHSRTRSILPRNFKRFLIRKLTYVMQYRALDRIRSAKRGDSFDDLAVPNEERVKIPQLWVVEIFPPSELQSLMKAAKKNEWDKNRIIIDLHEANREMIQQSRSARGWGWWRLAEITNIESTRYGFPDGVNLRLPREFSAIELKAIQIGGGLTAVVAHFILSDAASDELDKVWHADEEPELFRKRGRLPRAESRTFVKYRKTQQTRRRLHDKARTWLARACPGYFANNNELQPLIDLLVFDHLKIPTDIRMEHEEDNSLRALGITEHSLMLATSDTLPGLALDQVNPRICPAFKDGRTWAIWGNREFAASRLNPTGMFGNDASHAIGYAIHEYALDFFLLLTMSEMLAVVEKRYARLRDEARWTHGRFKARSIRHLRESVLTTSIDLESISRDMRKLYSARISYGSSVQFILAEPRWVSNEIPGRKSSEPINFNDTLREEQEKWMTELASADKGYREILSTVASLGASADTYKLSRVAIWIALASLMVALVTLLVTEIKPDSFLDELINWVKQAMRNL